MLFDIYVTQYLAPLYMVIISDSNYIASLDHYGSW